MSETNLMDARQEVIHRDIGHSRAGRLVRTTSERETLAEVARRILDGSPDGHEVLIRLTWDQMNIVADAMLAALRTPSQPAGPTREQVAQIIEDDCDVHRRYALETADRILNLLYGESATQTPTETE